MNYTIDRRSLFKYFIEDYRKKHGKLYYYIAQI